MIFLKRVHRIFFIALMVVGFLGSHAAFAQVSSLSPEVEEIFQQSRASNAFWSVVVRDSSGQLLEAHNPDKLVRPASNLKLLTSAAVLNELGEDYTFKTRMYGYGHQEGRTWRGDIIIQGSGDPSISGTFFDEDRFHVFEKFYSVLDSLGISRIDGNLIGNTSFFDDEPYPKGWNWDDLTYYYGVEISALSFNENAVDLQVFANDDVGETPRIQWFPFDTDYVTFLNDQVITPSNSEFDEFYRRILGTNTIRLESKVPQNYYEEESLAVMNAPRFFMDTFAKYLEDGNIVLNGRILIDNQQTNYGSRDYTTLAVHESPPLKNLLREMNKESNNFYAEMLLKTAAAERYDTQGSTELGISLIKDFAHHVGMDTTEIEMTDGSGMSPSTLLTMNDLNKMLVHLLDAPGFDSYWQTLAIGGIDGSLENRFRQSPLLGRVNGKTGYVSGVRSLSGIMPTQSGEKLLFSIATNNYTEETSYIDWLHERLLEQLYAIY